MKTYQGSLNMKMPPLTPVSYRYLEAGRSCWMLSLYDCVFAFLLFPRPPMLISVREKTWLHQPFSWCTTTNLKLVWESMMWPERIFFHFRGNTFLWLPVPATFQAGKGLGSRSKTADRHTVLKQRKLVEWILGSRAVGPQHCIALFMQSQPDPA